MTYQLIVLDLDGTLLNSRHEIPPANAAAIRACRDRGIHVVIASGRSFASVRPYAQSLGLAGPQITLNGAVLGDVASNTLHHKHTLTASRLALVSDELTRRGLAAVAFGADAVYAPPGTTELANLIMSYGEPEPIAIPRIASEYIPDPIKVLAFVEAGPVDNELRAILEPAVDQVRTGPPFLEWITPGVNKGMAVLELMEEWAIPREQVLVVGDSFNDLSMFDVAGTSVAMGGAVPAIKERADAITAGCDENGVAQALRRFVGD